MVHARTLMRNLGAPGGAGRDYSDDSHHHQNDTHHGQVGSAIRCRPCELQDRADARSTPNEIRFSSAGLRDSGSCAPRGYPGKGIRAAADQTASPVGCWLKLSVTAEIVVPPD
jgi:hypothetical protein